MMKQGPIVALAMLASWTTAATVIITPQTIPLEHSQAYIFSAPLTVETAPRLFVLDGRTLTIYSAAEAYTRMDLPATATALDVVDLDQDGSSEVVTVAGNQVTTRDIVPDEDLASWEVIVEAPSLYSDTAALPFPQVLAIEHGETVAIALPQEDGFEVWSLEGNLLETMPYTETRQAPAMPPLPFEVDEEPDAFAGQGSAMVHRIFSLRSPAPVDAMGQSFGEVMSDVSDLPSDQWPYFPLRLDRTEVDVLYAPIPPKFEDTYVRIRARSPAAEPQPRVGPPRRYPGRMLTGGNHLPDFNGDGFVDLVTWKADQPGASLNTLIKAVRNGTWPLTLSIRLYNPKSGLFEAEPFATIRTSLPRDWYRRDSYAGPMRNLLFDDFDADGFLDVGFSTRRNEYSIWNYEVGFGTEPAYVIHTADAVETIVRDVPFGAPDAPKLLLRSANALYVVRFPAD